MSKKETPVAADEETGAKMPKWFPLPWSTHSFSMSTNVIMMGYLTFYCTDVLGLNALIVGMILLSSKLIDAFTDIAFGFILEKTHTRLGKARPYEFGLILGWLFTVLLFTVPDASPTAQYVYIFFMYVLVNAICITCCEGVNAVYMVRCAPRKKDQITISTINGSIVMVLAIAFNIVLPGIIKNIGVSKPAWSRMMFMFAIPLGIIGMFRFIFCKEIVSQEVVEKEKKQKLKVGEMVKLVLRNRYTWLLFGIVLITNLINNLSTVTTYYFKYIIGDISLASLPAMSAALTPFVLLLFPVLAKKVGTTNVLRGGVMMGIIGLLIRSFGGANLITIIIGSAFFGIGIVPIAMMVGIYAIEAMEYGEWHTGTRIEGPLNALNCFATKAGPALASGLTGLIMGAAGYDGQAAVQSPAATTAIVAVYNWVPLFFFGVVFILTIMWKLDKLAPRMKEELAARRQGLTTAGE
jgi:Na+/melibiose symporter-like transporter